MTPQIEVARPAGVDMGPDNTEHPAITAGRLLLHDVLGDRNPAELGSWREAIDEIDHVIMIALAARVQATKQTGQLKAHTGTIGVDLARERQVISRAVDTATAIGIDQKPVVSLFIFLIGLAHDQHSRARREVDANTV